MQGRMIANANAPRTLNAAGFRGQRGVFAGINALTADKEALAKAKAMIARGDFPDDVWQETGWGQGADGKWRFEIDDSGSSLNMMNFPEQSAASINTKLSELLKHPRVYQNYPESKNMSVLAKSESGSGTGTMMGGMDGLMIVRGSGDNARSTTLHELQHAIQNREGFAKGGSPSQFNKDIYSNPDESYRRLGGEVEARMVENRMDLTPQQRRDIYPFAVGRYGYEDIPRSEQLFPVGETGRFGRTQESMPKRPLTEFEQAHLTAQRNAALPVNQRGLGLPADNTAMDRARAMGFDVDNPVYHGTNADIESFNTSGKGKTKGAGAFFSDSPIIPETYISGNQGGNIIPAFVKDDNLAVFDAKGANWNDIPVDSLSFKRKKASDLLGLEKGDYTSTDELASFAKDKGFGGVKVKNLKDRGANSDINRAKEYLKEKYGITPNQDWDNVTGNQFVEARDYVENLYKKTKSTITAVQDPSNIRSRFAAFDPFNRDSSNLLAQSAKLAPTTALGAYMYNEKRKKSQGKQ